MIAAANSNKPASELLTDEAMQSVTGGAANYIDDRDTIIVNSTNTGRSNATASVTRLQHLGSGPSKR